MNFSIILTLWNAVCGLISGKKESAEYAKESNYHVAAEKSHHRNCLGPPYIYATTHHEIPNIVKYSRDGCLLMIDVLIGGTIENELVEFRSMAFGDYKGHRALFVADATSDNSSVLVYDGDCDAQGHRHYIDMVVNTTLNEGANHCYGLTFDSYGNIYVSFQHTDNVMRYAKDSFVPMRFPHAIRNDRAAVRPFYSGTFYQFGQPMYHDIREQGVRSIAFVGKDLWICNEDVNGIVIVDSNTGITMNIIDIVKPIGIHYRADLGLVFVGSKVKHWQASVYSIDVLTYSKVQSYTNGRMNHPVGIISYYDDLFVGEIDEGQILKFSISSGQYVETIVDNPPGELEQLTLSDC